MQLGNVSKHKKLRAVSENYLAQSNFSLKELNEITGTKALLKRQKTKKPVQS